MDFESKFQMNYYLFSSTLVPTLFPLYKKKSQSESNLTTYSIVSFYEKGNFVNN